MGKKIITMLSAPPQRKPQRISYLAPDGKKYMGIQTNDAPLRYLLYHYGDEVDEIRCLVTPEARKTYERLQQLYSRQKYVQKWGFEMQEIPFPMEQDSQQTVLPHILEGLHEGDEILLDTTGGFRNVVMYLLLLSRIMSYQGIHVVEAVYGNFQTHQVENVTPMYQLFELVGGMQEMASFGSIETLQQYYTAKKADPVVMELLESMMQLKESINLCRTETLPEKIRQFQQALTTAESCADPMMKVLLPVFREKFGNNMDILHLIRWCLHSDMLQQALTIFVECVPEYLYGPDGLIQRDWALPVLKKDYESTNKAQLVYGVLSLSARCQNSKGMGQSQYLKWPEGYDWRRQMEPSQLRSEPSKHIHQLMDMFGGTYRKLTDSFSLRVLENLSVVANLAYGPGGTGPYQPGWEKHLPNNRKYLQSIVTDLESKQYQSMSEFLKAMHMQRKQVLECLLKIPAQEQYSREGAKSSYGRTIQNLKRLMELFGYSSKCTEKQLQHVLCDYNYIRLMRNMVNHANAEMGNERELQDYQHMFSDYRNPADMSSSDIKAVMEEILQRLEQTLQSIQSGLSAP